MDANAGYKEKYGFHDDIKPVHQTKKGLSADIVKEISRIKNEPEWMRDFRLKSFVIFQEKTMPPWAPDIDVDLNGMTYYIKSSDTKARDWNDVPEDIKRTFEKLGVPEAERKFLGGVGAMYESEMVYHSIEKELEKQGVIFLDMDTALKEHGDTIKKYLGTVVPPGDNKFAALNSACWSGGSFIYVPPGVRVALPLQAYFRINAQSMGQFERTLIIADKNSSVHYIEGCSAPVYSTDSLHAAVVEVIAMEGAHVRYTTIQNWSKNVYNLVTKRAHAHRNAVVEWVDGNLGCLAEGSRVTTPEGMTTIESLKIGDMVLSYDEQSGKLAFRKVIAKRFSNQQPVHTVSVGERKIRVTSNHPFYSYFYDPNVPKKLWRYKLGYVRADLLKEAIVPSVSIDYGMPYCLKKPLLVTEFQSLNQYNSNMLMVRSRDSRLSNLDYTNDDVMWLFGYWVGDGNIDLEYGKTKNVIRWAKIGFSTPKSDRARNRLINVMSSIVDAEPTERHDGLHICWNSKELAELFELNGFVGRAMSKRVPKWVWSLPESQRISFIAGYLDSDGTVMKTKRRFGLKSVNRPLLEDIASLLVTLGVTSRLNTEFNEPKTVTILGYECTAHGSHQLSFPLDERIVACVSPVLRNDANSVEAARFKHYRSVGRSKIELPESVEIADVTVSEASGEYVPTWDIEVEGTGNFISEGFIVHNSKLSMKYPCIFLMGEGASANILSIAFAGDGQQQDTGAKVIHLAPNTSSVITSKSVSKGGGNTMFRGLVRIAKGAHGSKSHMKCSALIMDKDSKSDTVPSLIVDEKDVTVGHEAVVGKIGEDQLFYLMSRGLSQSDATTLIVNGFLEPFVKELPFEYAIELNRLIQLEMK